MELKGKVALITGSSRGLGKAMAITFAKSGATVVVAARTEEPHPRIAGTIHQTVADIKAAGGNAIAIKCNVIAAEEVEALGKQVQQQLGRVDILVHNAAASFRGGVADLDLKRWDILMNLNFRGLFTLVKAVLPMMLAQSSGHILSISPKADPEFKGRPYIQSKQAATRLALTLADELKGTGIACNCLWPDGVHRTEYTTLIGVTAPVVYSAQLFADAAFAMVTKDPKTYTGHAMLDTEVLKAEGVWDITRYRV